MHSKKFYEKRTDYDSVYVYTVFFRKPLTVQIWMHELVAIIMN